MSRLRDWIARAQAWLDETVNPRPRRPDFYADIYCGAGGWALGFELKKSPPCAPHAPAEIRGMTPAFTIIDEIFDWRRDETVIDPAVGEPHPFDPDFCGPECQPVTFPPLTMETVAEALGKPIPLDIDEIAQAMRFPDDLIRDIRQPTKFTKLLQWGIDGGTHLRPR